MYIPVRTYILVERDPEDTDLKIDAKSGLYYNHNAVASKTVVIKGKVLAVGERVPAQTDKIEKDTVIYFQEDLAIALEDNLLLVDYENVLAVEKGIL